MTYLQVLLIFIVPLVLIESWFFFRKQDSQKKYALRGIILLAILAIVYTTPWDNYLIMTNVWSYEEDRVLGKIGYVPIEEYCFFVLQSFLTGFWTYFFIEKWPLVSKESKQTGLFRGIGALFLLLLALGIYCLRTNEGRYLGLILVWALPIIAFQWIVGGRYLISNWKVYLWALWPITIYLWVVDAIAIHLHVWKISMTQTTGFFLINLPIEEAVFFLVTNLMLVQGLILFIAMKESFPLLAKRLALRG